MFLCDSHCTNSYDLAISEKSCKLPRFRHFNLQKQHISALKKHDGWDDIKYDSSMKK